MKLTKAHYLANQEGLVMHAEDVMIIANESGVFDA